MFEVRLTEIGPNPNAAAIALGRLLSLSVKERRARLANPGVIHTTASKDEADAIAWALKEAGAVVEVAEVATTEPADDIDARTIADAILAADDIKAVLEIVENENEARTLSRVMDLLIASGKVSPNSMAAVSDRIRVLLRPKPGQEGSIEILSTQTKSLEVLLNEQEKHDAADQVVELTAELERVKDEAKFHADTYKARLTLLDDTRRGEIRKRQTGREFRIVEIVTVYDLSAEIVRVIRTDTNQILEQRGASAEERQRSLFGRR